ncbi:hypothetical protein CIB48_g2192 [Xylaria polymorpha]|nr:hypothetical protein CIB48_g2192 [Xylaria polymorpha]
MVPTEASGGEICGLTEFIVIAEPAATPSFAFLPERPRDYDMPTKEAVGFGNNVPTQARSSHGVEEAHRVVDTWRHGRLELVLVLALKQFIKVTWH